MKPAGLRAGALALAIGLNAWIDVRLLSGHADLALAGWLASIVLLVLAVPAPPSGDTKRWRPATIALVCLPALVRIADYRLDRIHGDDMLSAYFSATLDLGRRSFFAAVPADPSEWVAQFPAPYFALQRLFFDAFGESLLTIKLSVLPYVVLTAAFLYAIARDLVDERAALLAVLVYGVFGPSVYLETLALHFHASTAVFLAFFYYAIRELRSGAPRAALAAALAAGGCYLFYLSSFIALPLALVFFLTRGGAERERHVARNLALFALGVAFVLGPFVCDAMHHATSVARRFEQVSLLGGEWSPFRERSPGQTSAGVLAWSFARSLRSIYENGVGGHGGYDFGRQALLEPLALILVVLGLVRALWLARTRPDWWLLLGAIVVSFVTGIVLTIPPPAFHRFSIAFPFLALLAALPAHAILGSSIGSAAARRTVVALLLVGLATTQHLYFLRAALPENEFAAIRLARFLDDRFPGRPLRIAASPSFAFEKIYRFASDGRGRPAVKTEYPGPLLETLDPNRKYLYVILFADQFAAQFVARDPAGRMIRFSDEYSVFVN